MKASDISWTWAYPALGPVPFPRCCTRYWSIATVLWALLVGSGGFNPGARAGCPSIVPEAVFGSAVRGKVGFECGECPKKFYLVEAYEGGSFIQTWSG